MLIPTLVPRGSSRFHSAGLIDPGHAERDEVETFIARVYAERYGAELRSFLPQLLAFRDPAGGLQAAVGLRRGQDGPLFVEHYLDLPAEAALRARVGQAVGRHELVEAGNFASRSPGDAREVIVQLTGLLHRAGVRWVLFAATRQLRNAFDRLRLDTGVLAEARSERLPHDGTHWGSYYASQPQLLFGDIATGHAFLQRRAEAAVPAAAAPMPGACAVAAR